MHVHVSLDEKVSTLEGPLPVGFEVATSGLLATLMVSRTHIGFATVSTTSSIRIDWNQALRLGFMVTFH